MDPAVATALEDLHVEFHQASSDILSNMGATRVSEARARLIETYAIAVERILKAAKVESPKKPGLELSSNIQESNRSAWLQRQARAAGYGA